MTGRPSSFTEDIAATICERLVEGQSLREICRDDAMPDQTTVFRWLRQNDSFRQQYTHAREDQAAALEESLLNIADEAAPEDTQRAKLMVDTRKWVMSKMAPKKYGDKTELTGKDGKDLIPSTDPADVARRFAFMLATVAAQAKTED